MAKAGKTTSRSTSKTAGKAAPRHDSGKAKPRKDSADARSAPRFDRTRNDHSRERAEDYVELIAELTAERGEARAVDMARRLGVSHVTVTRTVARLQKAGWVKSEPYRAIFLTPAGEELAAEARARHLVVLEFLRAAGVSAQTANLDAEGIEHHVSPETLAALKKLTAKIRED